MKKHVLKFPLVLPVLSSGYKEPINTIYAHETNMALNVTKNKIS
ncbi:hypothetical protein SAMN04489761_3981 [Tenacibaculum sp. MAR_2009_124]|nr:hypothetical protein SAMN04489761_3981 [Tenacibaculum sp. MAR_2009_124]